MNTQTLSKGIKKGKRMTEQIGVVLDDCVCTTCKGEYIRYSIAEEDFCCWDCGSKDYEEKEKE